MKVHPAPNVTLYLVWRASGIQHGGGGNPACRCHELPVEVDPPSGASTDLRDLRGDAAGESAASDSPARRAWSTSGGQVRHKKCGASK